MIFWRCFAKMEQTRYLIGTVGSWKDTMDDEEVLDDLQRLNEGRPYFDHIIASRDDRTA
jgi:hypothetical protein